MESGAIDKLTPRSCHADAVIVDEGQEGLAVRETPILFFLIFLVVLAPILFLFFKIEPVTILEIEAIIVAAVGFIIVMTFIWVRWYRPM